MVHRNTKRKISVYNEVTCKFYHEEQGDWSTEGCSTARILNTTTNNYNVECVCNHLTSFAVLMVTIATLYFLLLSYCYL